MSQSQDGSNVDSRDVELKISIISRQFKDLLWLLFYTYCVLI